MILRRSSLTFPLMNAIIICAFSNPETGMISCEINQSWKPSPRCFAGRKYTTKELLEHSIKKSFSENNTYDNFVEDVKTNGKHKRKSV